MQPRGWCSLYLLYDQSVKADPGPAVSPVESAQLFRAAPPLYMEFIDFKASPRLELLCRIPHPPPLITEDLMLDVVMLVLGTGFFALCIAYVFACERL